MATVDIESASIDDGTNLAVMLVMSFGQPVSNGVAAQIHSEEKRRLLRLSDRLRQLDRRRRLQFRLVRNAQHWQRVHA